MPIARATQSAASPASPTSGQRSWSSATRVLFRFGFIYLVLYSLIPLTLLSTTLLHRPWLSIESRKLWTALSALAAMHIFRVSRFGRTCFASDSGLGWSLVGSFVAVSAAATILWSAADRRRQEYSRLHAWLRVIVQAVLALTLVDYGAQKIWPNQMPVPRLHQLLSELGSYSPGQLFWVFVGASPGYERFAGFIELLAGGLLFVPALTTLGALLAFIATAQVFAFNVYYDVQVKVFSFHLFLMAAFLLVPDIRRLADASFLPELPPRHNGRRYSHPDGWRKLRLWDRFSLVPPSLLTHCGFATQTLRSSTPIQAPSLLTEFGTLKISRWMALRARRCLLMRSVGKKLSSMI